MFSSALTLVKYSLSVHSVDNEDDPRHFGEPGCLASVEIFRLLLPTVDVESRALCGLNTSVS